MGDFVRVPASKSGAVVEVLLDPDDHAALGGRRLSIGSHGYAQLAVEGRVETLHRWLLGLQPGDGRIGDHRDGNVLDCRRSNLRVVDPSGSSQNVAGRGRTGLRGVYLAHSGKFVARCKFQGKQYHLGTYDTPEEAFAVADAKRRELMPFYVPPEHRAA